MKLPVLLVGSLLALTMALPVREKRDIDDDQFMKAIKVLKDPATYADFKEIAAMANKAKEEGLRAIESDSTSEEDKVADLILVKLMDHIGEHMSILYELAQETLVDGAKPREEKLTELAKRFSKVLRDSGLKLRDAMTADNGALMDDEAVEALKKIVETATLKETGNDFLPILKEKIPKLYEVAEQLKDVVSQVKNSILNNELIVPHGHHMKLKQFLVEFVFGELIEILKSEENAIVAFKNFGVLTDTIKTASSYENLQAMYNALARSKRLESHAILIREAGKCLGAELSDVERANMHKHIQKILDMMKVAFADGQQDTAKFTQLQSEFEQNNQDDFNKLLEKMFASFKTPAGIQRFRQCLVKNPDREVYRAAMAVEDYMNDEHLQRIRSRNEKVYAIVQLIDSDIRAVQRREGLGIEAKSFLKDALTPQYVMAHLAEYFNPSDDAKKLIVKAKKFVTDRFNLLSVEARKELVEMFPYRTLIRFALLQ